MDKEGNHQNQEIITSNKLGNNNSDRLKRDEWSEGAVSCLLEAYEAKWILRNRAKLKGQDWEDVAKHVSARANSTKSPKTQTQCKNKIESMKKRYRSESATAADASSWPLYPRLDLLLRGNAAASSSVPPPPAASLPPQSAVNNNTCVIVVETPQPAIVPPLPPPPAPLPPPPPPLPTALPIGNCGQNSHGSNGFDRGAKEDVIMDAKMSDNAISMDDTNSSTPAALYSDRSKANAKMRSSTMENKKKKRKRGTWEIAESIRLLAEVVVRSEQARMETMREIERMRAEAETKEEKWS